MCESVCVSVCVGVCVSLCLCVTVCVCLIQKPQPDGPEATLMIRGGNT